MAYIRPFISWNDVPIVMDLPMAARIVGVTIETLKKRCQKGTFPGYKEGKFWRVNKDDLREHMEENRRPRPEPVPATEDYAEERRGA